ncbi:MAG: YdcF family protein [Flavobacteriales bacterium]|nr:YdcF family protein [Flavobacteriales bacterium]
MKLRYKFLLGILLTLLVFGTFRTTFYRAAGAWLIVEDPLEPADAIFLLGGGAFDRVNETAKLLEQGIADKVICSGSWVSGVLKILKMEYKEAEVSRLGLVNNHGIAVENVDVILEGTSTKEESELILAYCKKNQFKTVIVLSSTFHTRRVSDVFKPLLEPEGIKVIIHGAPSSSYNEDEWWKDEGGMIMVNNEYMKHIYYFLKY